MIRAAEARQVFDQAHRLIDRGRDAQAALDARAQHAVGAEALEQDRERPPEIVAGAQDHGLRLQAEIVQGEHFDQLVERSDSAGKRDEEIGRLGHSLFALGERVHDLQRADVVRGALWPNKMARHDAEHLAARRSGRARRDAHQPAAAAAVDEAQAACGAGGAELRGEAARRRRQLFDRRAEQAHRVSRHATP